jgi:hypothetical protein
MMLEEGCVETDTGRDDFIISESIAAALVFRTIGAVELKRD